MPKHISIPVEDTVELFKDIPVPEEKEGLFGGTDKKTLKDNATAQRKLTKAQKV